MDLLPDTHPNGTLACWDFTRLYDTQKSRTILYNIQGNIRPVIYYRCIFVNRVLLLKTGVGLGWFLSILTFLVTVFGSLPLQAASFEESVIGSAIYESTSRVAWASALAWMVFACINGLGGPVNWFLSLSVWQPLSRMSYAIYLVHLPIQLIVAAQVRTGTYFSDTQAVSVWK